MLAKIFSKSETKVVVLSMLAALEQNQQNREKDRRDCEEYDVIYDIWWVSVYNAWTSCLRVSYLHIQELLIWGCEVDSCGFDTLCEEWPFIVSNSPGAVVKSSKKRFMNCSFIVVNYLTERLTKDIWCEKEESLVLFTGCGLAPSIWCCSQC